MRIQEFDFSINITPSLLWQRNTAVALPSMINQKQAWYTENHTQFWIDWCANVFNVATANSFGLAVWCIILQVPYFIPATAPQIDKPIWGFNEEPPINTYVNFDNGNFVNDNFPVYSLSLEDQRIVVQLRYFQLITRGAIPEINLFLDKIFNNPDGIYQGGAWALDNFDMTMTYEFNCPISNNLFNVLRDYDLLPRPAGVELTYTIL